MLKRICAAVLTLCLMGAGAASAAKAKKADEKGDEKKEAFSAGTFAGLALRGIGPALTSGRIGDLAVHPTDRNTWFAAVSSGGVWKTTNAGTTWTPVFDDQGSYSIGCVTIDPENPLVVWVGTGENNSQRSVSYGDGVYKSIDGGTSWKNVGLGESEHIGKIVIDPRNSEVVYVAAQGPLWGPGGDRGLYKTTDGGETWERVLAISENTGVTDVVLHPEDPDTLYAAAYQRRRRVWTLIDGGPEAAIHKSTDGGKTWKKVTKGLPDVDLGRIGLAVTPLEPDWVYAIVEAAGEEEGFFRSTDRGESWEKRSDYVSGSPQYYQEIFVDPADPLRVYSMDVFMQVSTDGGKTFGNAGEEYKHVDNHALWIDPDDPEHLLTGCDGGVYESFDRAVTWHFKANLPVTQFYKVSVDEAFPFYHVFGGTQDNFSLGGPSRTTTVHGITNADWFITLGGDGFETQVDPEDPDVIYSQAQYGELNRFDKASGEAIDIQPQGEPGEALRWNWDSPLLISPHSHTRLYFAANRLFRSDDRGNTWRAVSPDLTRRIDRNRLEVMGRVWSVDAVAKNRSTSFYGTIVALAESPLVEGLLYVGTDDGLVQVSEDGGGTWRKVESFPGVPERPYVSRVEASQHDPDTVYAAFDAHKDADFKPYVLKSTDRGRSWTSIAGDLPERGSVYALAEDHVEPGLLFAGTEFGAFFTVDGGGKWVQLKGGVPVIAVRDLAIQKRENDLVLGTFGRGFYVLDDYTPLRRVDEARLEGEEAILFPVDETWMYIEGAPLGLRGKSFQGHAYYTAPNPPFGSIFTYYLKDEIQTREEKRRKAEEEVEEEGGDIFYPTWEELRSEDREEKPAVLLTVSDEEGNVIRRLEGPVAAGMHRVSWDLRFPPPTPTRLEPPPPNPFFSGPQGPMVVPGTYTVTLARRVDGEVTPLGEPQSFRTVPLGRAKLAAEDRMGLLDFQRKTARLQRAVLGAVQAAGEAQTRLDHIKKALDDTPEQTAELAERARALEERLADVLVDLEGDRTIASRQEPTPPSITDRVERVVSGHWTSSTAAATTTQRTGYEQAAEAFAPVLDELRKLIEEDLAALEREMEEAGAPWTPGRVPRWTPE